MIYVVKVKLMLVLLQVFLVIVWNFELYMLPVTLLIVFFKNLLVVHIVGNLMKEKEDDVSTQSDKIRTFCGYLDGRSERYEAWNLGCCRHPQ